MSRSLLSVGLIAIILLAVVSYLWGSNDKEILRAQLEMEHLRSSRDSLTMIIALKDSAQKLLQQQVAVKEQEANLLREQVDVLEEKRREEQLTVRGLRRTGDLQAKFEQTFPEVAKSDWGIREVYNADADLEIEYLLVPLWFSETFIIDHQNSKNYQAQRDTLLRIDALNLEIFGLKDSILVLQEEKTTAFEEGYNEAYQKYEDLNRKYIDELSKPDFGIWQWTAIAGGIGVGYLIGNK